MGRRVRPRAPGSDPNSSGIGPVLETRPAAYLAAASAYKSHSGGSYSPRRRQRRQQQQHFLRPHPKRVPPLGNTLPPIPAAISCLPRPLGCSAGSACSLRVLSSFPGVLVLTLSSWSSANTFERGSSLLAVVRSTPLLSCTRLLFCCCSQLLSFSLPKRRKKASPHRFLSLLLRSKSTYKPWPVLFEPTFSTIPNINTTHQTKASHHTTWPDHCKKDQ